MKLGKLEKVKDLRSVWKHEANDFTKWLAKEENLNMIKDSIEYLVSKGKNVFFDAEHFFDGYKADKDYAIKALKTMGMTGIETAKIIQLITEIDN